MISATNLFNDLVSKITEAGRSLTGVTTISNINLETLCEYLLTGKGEATGIAIAREILSRYKHLDNQGKHAFFKTICDDFGSDQQKLEKAFSEWKVKGTCCCKANSLRLRAKEH